MQTIYARSPFLVRIGQTSQVSTKLELFIWNNYDTEPITPTITLSKNIPSLTQIDCEYDISPYIREKIVSDFEFMEDDLSTYEGVINMTNVRIKRYYKLSTGSFTLIDNVLYNAVYGYTEYQSNVNANPNNSQYPYFNSWYEMGLQQVGATQNFASIKALFNNYSQVSGTSSKPVINTISKRIDSGYGYGMMCFIVEKKLSTGDNVYIMVGSNSYQVIASGTPVGSYYIGIPYNMSLSSGFYDVKVKQGSTIVYNLGKVEVLDECKYDPTIIFYINKYGGVEQFTFFKTLTENYDVTGSNYSLYKQLIPSGSQFYYDARSGQSRDFNVTGNETFKVSSGFVPESYGERIKELMLSEDIRVFNIYYGFRRVKIKTKSMKFQKHINDKTINYELEFEMANDIINNIS